MDIETLTELNTILSDTKLITSDAKTVRYQTLLAKLINDTINDTISSPSISKTLSQVGLLSLLQGYQPRSTSLDVLTGRANLFASNSNQGFAYLNNPITFANNATDPNNDIDFSAGNFNFSDGSGQAISTAMTKRLDATWSAGTGNGGLFNGTVVPKAVNSTYHCYKIYNPTTGADDSGFLLGIAGVAPDPTSVLPSGYTKFKRIGSILTDGSGNIRQASYTFFLGGYYCNYNTEISDAFPVALTTTKVSLTLSTPKGIQTIANVHPYFDITNGRDTLIIYEGSTSKPYFYVRGGATTIANAQVGSNGTVKTNLSSQIDWKTTVFSIPASLFTNGFTDYTN